MNDPQLSPKDSTIRDLLLTDASMKDIAYRMGIPVCSASSTAIRIYRLTGVENRVGLMAREIENLRTKE